MLEALENRYLDIFDYIHQRPMKSVEELLPTYNYLYDEIGNDYILRDSYPNNYPRNEFLETLNNADKIKLLKSVELTKIVGKAISETSTISGYNVVDSDDTRLWLDGYPKYFDIPVLNRQGIIKGGGDSTVPLYSAEATEVPADQVITLQSEHNDLPTGAQQDILEILTGKRPENKIDEWQIDDIITGFVFSPVDIQVVSPSGKRLGKNFRTNETYNEVEGAYYTGFNTNTEFFTIPNPEDGEYKILTEGTGTGDYIVEVAKISTDEESEPEGSAVTLTGTVEPDKREEATIKVEGTTVEKITIPDPMPDDPVDSPNPGSSNSATNDQDDSSGDNGIGIAEDSSDGNSVIGSVESDNQTDIQKSDALKEKVRQYFKSGQIKKRKEAKIITQKLEHIRMYLKRYETGTAPKKLKKARMKANRDIDKLIRFVNKKTPRFIMEGSRDSLIESLNDLRID